MPSFFNQLSIRHKLLISFLIILLVPLFATIYSNYLQNQKIELERKVEVSSNLENKLFQIIVTRQLFLAYEATLSNFFENNSTELLTKENSLRNEINKSISKIQSIKYQLNDINQLELDSAVQNFQISTKLFDSLTRVIRSKGNENFGLEKFVRNFAQDLEKYDKNNQILLLQIRRKEKDYLLRKDEADKDRWIELTNKYSKNLSSNSKLLLILKQYVESFEKLYEAENSIGNNKTGIRSKMLVSHENSVQFMSKFSIALKEYSSFKSTSILVLQVVSTSLAFILSLVFALLASFHITQPILILSKSMHEASKAAPSMDMTEMKDLAERTDEVGLLTRQYNKLLQQIKSSFFIIRQNAQTLEESNKQLQILNTELKDRESYLELLNSQKDKFLSMISHDMRGPLVSIMGFMDFYKDNFNSLTEEELQFVSVNMNSHLKRVVEMLDGMLLWSRSQTGELKAQPQIVELDKLVKEVVDIAVPIALQKEITLEYDLKPAGIWADKNMVQFMARNLISNATKFSHPKSAIQIIVNSNESGSNLIIKDKGVGISKDNLEHLFDGHVNKSTFGTAQEQGVGLGLVLCKDFITKCFGDIKIESEVGVGTTVYLHFPTPEKVQPRTKV